MKLVILGFVGLLTAVASAEKQSFERYQSIIDRQMFGPLPPGFDPTKLPSEVQKSSSAQERELSKEQEQLKSAIHFSVINVAADGKTEVGFTDNSDPKTPRHYFLKVGDSRDGWTVKEADAEKATMTIAKDEIEVSLSLGGNSASGAGTTSRAGAGTTSRAGAGTTSRAGAAPTQARSSGLFAGGSLRARRMQRRQEEAAAKAQADAAAAEKEAAREAERQAQAEQEKAQREAERAEQRQQLLAIQEELKRVREAKAAAEAAKASEDENAQNEVE